jgi:4-amino-4-deoxy-L-arabinose transferase-like glycosyltransferase
MRRYVLPAAILVAIATFRIVSTYGVLSHTMDEPTHLGAGMEWLDHGTYAGDTSHPPLARVLSAAAVYLDGARYIPADSALDEGLKLLGRDAHYDRVLSLARMGILPFFWLASAAVFWWAWRVGGGMAAVAATLLFTTTPPVLAHAGLVTTDMAATAMCTIAALASLAWAKRPDVARSVALGISLGLGVIAKFSFIVFLPAFWALMLLWKRPAFSEMLRYVRPAMGALLLGCVVIWAGYGFTFGAVEPLGWTLPAPPLWDGLRLLLKHNTEGHSSYILGEQHHNGVWYFFPVILAVKTPLGFLLLLPWALWVARRERIGIAAPLLFSAGILAVAMTSRINIGVRHVLPIYVVFMSAFPPVLWLMLRHRNWVMLASVLLYFSARHFGWNFPSYPSGVWYFNPLAWQLLFVLGAWLALGGANTLHFLVRSRLVLIVGVIYDPMRNELWSGEKGQRPLLNGKPVRVSPRTTLAEAVVSIGLAKTSATIDAGLPLLEQMVHRVRKCRMLGSAALDMAYVACGRLDAYIEQSISLWDIAAGCILVENAGGRVELQPRSDAPEKYNMVASNGLLDLRN